MRCRTGYQQPSPATPVKGVRRGLILPVPPAARPWPTYSAFSWLKVQQQPPVKRYTARVEAIGVCLSLQRVSLTHSTCLLHHAQHMLECLVCWQPSAEQPFRDICSCKTNWSSYRSQVLQCACTLMQTQLSEEQLCVSQKQLHRPLPKSTTSTPHFSTSQKLCSYYGQVLRKCCRV